jgi:hypothetical protein
MPIMSETPKRDRLLAIVDKNHSSWKRIVEHTPRERMLEPTIPGGWSGKDLTAHLNGWRTRTVARLEAAADGTEPAPPLWPIDADEDVDNEAVLERVNRWIDDTNRDRSLDDLLAEAEDQYTRMRAALLQIPEDAVESGSRFKWLDGHTIGDVVRSSSEHLHDEHGPDLRRVLP